MPKIAPTMLIALVFAMLLTACTEKGSKPVDGVFAPRLDQYAPEFQTQLADEIEASPLVTCPRDILVPDCAAWKRMIVDYIYLRDRITAATEGAQ